MGCWLCCGVDGGHFMANANVRFLRIDTRLVHGQIIVRWTTVEQCRRVMIIDRAVDADPFMSGFYRKASQKGVLIDVTSPERAKLAWDAGEFGEAGENVLVVFKDVSNAYDTWRAGFPMEAVNLGNQVSIPGRKRISRDVYLCEDDYLKLREMSDAGVRVFMQVLPEDEPLGIERIGEAFAPQCV
jgi:D-glucosaminate-specific PTS system IIB component